MRNTRTLLIAGAAALATLGACTNMPSAPEDNRAHAVFDSGVLVGSGHDKAAETTSASTASDSTTTQRGGHGFGSGN